MVFTAYSGDRRARGTCSVSFALPGFRHTLSKFAKIHLTLSKFARTRKLLFLLEFVRKSFL
jgi:hypothetical protein